jgi:hypothetical protein
MLGTMPEYNLNLGHERVLPYPFQLIFISHYTIRRYIIWAIDNVVK